MPTLQASFLEPSRKGGRTLKYRYFVSYFVKLNIGDNGTGINMNGHIENGIYEINHPLTTKDEVDRFTQWLQGKQKSPAWTVILLGFSLMYIVSEGD